MAEKRFKFSERDYLIHRISQAHVEPGMSEFIVQGILAKHIYGGSIETTNLFQLRQIWSEIEVQIKQAKKVLPEVAEVA